MINLGEDGSIDRDKKTTYKNISVIGSNSIKARQIIKNNDDEVDDLTEEKELYEGYILSDLQFLIDQVESTFLEVEIPYDKRLTDLEAKYAVVCKYNSEEESWKEINSYRQTNNKKILFNINESGKYAIFLNQYWYSTFTQNLADEYPQWTHIRRSVESVGQQFLNFFGITFEEVDSWLNWIYQQKFIGLADTHALDWAYNYPLPGIREGDKIRVFCQEDGQTTELPILKTIQEFFYNQKNSGGIIDYEQKRFYSQYYYDEVRVLIERKEVFSELKSTPIVFNVWNTFDEFGLLLNIKRNHLETNAEYKERILDVFRYPANSSETGLYHGIARELNLIERSKENHLEWKNDFKKFVLKNKTGWPIRIESIRVNYKPITEDQYEVINESHIIIHPFKTGLQKIVSFIYGIETYQFYDKENPSLNKKMFKDDGQASGKMLSWISYINTVSPIMWDKFVWDEGFWDTIDKDLKNLGFIPNIWDSTIEPWKDYKLKENRWEGDSIWETSI